MATFRYKVILGILSLILLISSIHLLSGISLDPQREDPSYRSLAASIILSFNVAILFGMLSFGIPLGLTLGALSVVAVLLLNMRMGLEGYSLLTLSFVWPLCAGYICGKVSLTREQSYLLRSEKMEEEINIFANNIEEKKKGISALEEKLRRYSALRGVVEAFSTALSLDQVARLIIDRASSTLGKKGRVLLFLVDTDRQELMLLSSLEDGKVKAKKGDVFDHWVLRHRKSLIIEDVERDFRFPAQGVEEAKAFFKSLIATPLMSENKVIGIMRMDSQKEFIYTQDDLRLLDIIANLGSVAIENAILYSRTQELAITDGLTGLAVRRYFMERFSEELKRAARRKRELSVLMLDIDHFKEYNDRYGHTAGDLVLKHLARTIHSKVQEGDIVARYGGEEILILLSGRNKKEAAEEAEEIRQAIGDTPLTLRRSRTYVTVSVGISTYPEDAGLEEELIRIADERLYKAKTGGRNKVCVR